MIFASPTADIDQQKPVTTTFPPDEPETPVGVTHESDAPPAPPTVRQRRVQDQEEPRDQRPDES